MSLQFGLCNLRAAPVDPEYITRVRSLASPYSPDGHQEYSGLGINVLYAPFHTTKANLSENQPCITKSGAVVTWDGRLDNRNEILQMLGDVLEFDSADSSIAATAYELLGTRCFAKLVGDWTISIWDGSSRSLILAKDAIGVRHLYYAVEREQVRWGTLLDPLVLFADHSYPPNEEYVAGWLSFFPAAHLTPYEGIHSVPPASFVLLTRETQRVTQYWNFDSRRKIRYGTDREYEEHFVSVFADSIRRRLQSAGPVVAELSGGVDSSSIVCMADHLIAKGKADPVELHTLSYFDDSEPHWNERPYFTSIEQQRGRKGWHIDVGSAHILPEEYEAGRFSPTPGGVRSHDRVADQFAECMAVHATRVLLSGIGGDEVLGGVPTPIPELADLLAQLRLRALWKGSIAWAIAKRKPVLHLVRDTLSVFLPFQLLATNGITGPADWIDSSFLRRFPNPLRGYERRTTFAGPRPSFQGNLSALEGLQRQLASSALPKHPLYEKRYPYLDRDLLEFLFSVPREQLVRPNERRSLMRRALARIVPNIVLNRRSKAVVSRGPLYAIGRERDRLENTARNMLCSSLGFVDSRRFLQALETAAAGKEIHVMFILRTLALEYWLRHLRNRGLLEVSLPAFANRSVTPPVPSTGYLNGTARTTTQ